MFLDITVTGAADRLGALSGSTRHQPRSCVRDENCVGIEVGAEGSKLAREVGCGLDGCERAHGQKLDFGTIRTLRPASRAIGSAFRPGAECYSVDGGSAGFAFGSEGRGPEAKGL